MMLVSMLCWGSWANTQKIDKKWRFELFYWDYMWGILVCALLFGLTIGRTNPAAPASFFLTICSFVAACTPMVGPATSFSLAEGNTMISAAWGVFVWKEFRGATSEVKHLLAVMFTFFVLGLVSISLAPVFG
jgi:hypothetical protein